MSGTRLSTEQALRLVDSVPRTTAELYRTAAGLSETDKITASHKNARRHLGATLERLAQRKVIHRGVIAETGARPVITFWLDTAPSGRAGG